MENTKNKAPRGGSARAASAGDSRSGDSRAKGARGGGALAAFGGRGGNAHHDIFFKSCYSDPRFALELFQMALSPEELAAFDWKGLKSEKDTFKDLRADLVFSVPLKGQPRRKAKLCLLLEHKSQFSRKDYHQILKYKTLIIGQSLERGEDDFLVHAFLFYHGKTALKRPKSFKEGFWGRGFCKKSLPP